MPAVQTGITTVASGQILTARDFLVADDFPNSPFTFNPDPGAVSATATLTVTASPVGAGSIVIGIGSGFSATLTTAGGVRTSGLNDFDNTVAINAIATSIADAINDAGNVFLVMPGITAVAVGAVVTITVSAAGNYGNNYAMSTTCTGLQFGSTSGSTQVDFAGGLDSSFANGSAGWLLRGLCSINVEGLRSIYIQLYHYPYYFIRSVQAPLLPPGAEVRVPAREYLTWRPVARSAPLVNQTGTSWPYEPASEWFPLAAPQICPIGVPISTRLDVGGMSEVSIEISQNTFPNQTLITGGMGVNPWPVTPPSPFVDNAVDRFRLIITAAA